jgi:multidrug efflux pump subunit AcrA (membrane-fusion protein)
VCPRMRLLNPLSGILIIAATLSFSCARQETAVKANDTKNDTQDEVGTALVEKRSVGQHLTLSSELVPFQEIDVYAKEPGYVRELNVDYGSHVKKGQVMAVLEIPELQAQLDEDQAAIRAQSDQVTRLQSEVSRAKAQHNMVHLQAQRLAGVAKAQAGLVAQQEVDDAESKDLAAESQVSMIIRKSQLLSTASSPSVTRTSEHSCRRELLPRRRLPSSAFRMRAFTDW